jgi:ubiquitin-protein ligase E3 C
MAAAPAPSSSPSPSPAGAQLPPRQLARVLRVYELLGALLGKALYEGILVSPRLTDFFLRKLLGRGAALDDLASLDPELHRSYVRLLRLPPADAAALGLAWEVTEELPPAAAGGAPRALALPLAAGAPPVAATAAGLRAFVAASAAHRLGASIAPQCAAFLAGFRAVIPLAWARMFAPAELQRLISGDDDAPIDLADLRAHTVYGAGLYDGHPYVAAFWRVLASFDEPDKRAFLAFVTAVARPPLLGFGSLVPRFAINAVRIAADGDKLPSAATCMSLLKLPVACESECAGERLAQGAQGRRRLRCGNIFVPRRRPPFPPDHSRADSTEAVLRDKLLTAVRSGSGFELT